jgi:DNA-binding response OmpR family regulator
MTERKKRVLVIDDDEDILVYLSTWFKDQGMEVDIAHNGAEASEKIQLQRPDLITLDIVMPQKTGVRFYRDVRGNKDTATIPIIIITGVQREFETFISHRRTAPPPEGYLSKPFGRDELLETVQRVLGALPKEAQA